MKFCADFKHVKWCVSMNYLLSCQFCLNFGNLCIDHDVSSNMTVAVAALRFCLVDIKCSANISLQWD